MKKIVISIMLGIIPILALAQSATTSDELNSLILQLQAEQQGKSGIDFFKDAIDQNTGLPSGMSDQISLNIAPYYPTPNSTVKANVKSQTSNLDKSMFTWTLDGVQIEKGIGIKEIEFKTKGLANTQRLYVRVDKIEGGVFEKTINVKTSEVDLYYEAQTYTPPFFKGKPQFSKQSAVRVIATPRAFDSAGRLIPAEEYVYKWSVNGTVMQDKSGYSRNVFEYSAPLFSKPVKFSVYVSSLTPGSYGENSITIVPQDAKALIYENNPIYGIIFENVVRGIKKLNRDEISFVAMPYYFSKDTSYLKYGWEMNGVVIDENSNDRGVTFRQNEGVKGISNIAVNINNETSMFQMSSSDFSLEFGEQIKKAITF